MPWDSKWFSQTRFRRRHIEAYLTFAILILVMACTIAVYRRETGYANQAACAQRLKRLMFSMQMYAQDNDGRYPPKENWARAILPYVDSLNVFICPSGENLPRFHSIRKKKAINTHDVTSYWYIEPPDTDSDSSKVPVVGDIIYANFLGNHNSGGNVAFLDSHVKWYTMEQWHRHSFPLQALSKGKK